MGNDGSKLLVTFGCFGVGELFNVDGAPGTRCNRACVRRLTRDAQCNLVRSLCSLLQSESLASKPYRSFLLMLIQAL